MMLAITLGTRAVGETSAGIESMGAVPVLSADDADGGCKHRVAWLPTEPDFRTGIHENGVQPVSHAELPIIQHPHPRARSHDTLRRDLRASSASRCPAQPHEQASRPERYKSAHRVRDHERELFERELAVPVPVGLHDRLVDDLLQLLVLEVVPHLRAPSAPLNADAKRAHHHLEHEEELAVRDEPVAVHVVHLERDCAGRSARRVRRAPRATYTAREENALRPPTNSWKSTVPPPLRALSPHAHGAMSRDALLVEDRDHAGRERVRRDLRDLQELLAVDRARAVAGEGAGVS
jgi:hypothetical protein